MQNEKTTNELDNPTELNKAPATTAEILIKLKGLDPEEKRRREYVKKELVKLEHEAWQHDDTADYTEATMIPPIDQAIEQNAIAIERHREIIQGIIDSKSHTREDRERKKASEEDIKALEKDQVQRASLKAKITSLVNSRRGQAEETRMHLKFLAEKYANLFTETEVK